MTNRELYQQMHDDNKYYQANNWLVDEFEYLAARASGTLVEIGCGNGRFLALAAGHFGRVTGIDFARSPLLDEVLAGATTIRFEQIDLTIDPLDLRADLVVSADVLEHIQPEQLGPLIEKISLIGPVQFHKIACYPDDWRHPSVFDPDHWLGLFRSIDPAFETLKTEQRRGRDDQTVVTIARGIGA